MLKKLIEKMDYYKDRPSDAFKNGVNVGLDTAIGILEKKIEDLERAKH